ncbi:MAG: ATP-grasp domain-containing protein [Pirellulales bacterium]
MHFFLYEWSSGGGLVNETGALPASLVREGITMAGALAADLIRIPGSRVTALRDPRVVQLALHGCEIVDVQSSASQREEFERLAAEADATFLIAPEFDGILLKAARRAVDCGSRLRSPSPEFIRLAADKHATCERLAVSGVPVPSGILLEPEQKLPADFSYPAVLKPIDGAGSQDTLLVAGPHDEPAPYAWPRRLERYMTGLAASVSVLCGPAGRVPLVPCKQRISEDGRLRYLGGELPISAGLAERAVSLAGRALAALPATQGYVGVDLVLGRDPGGAEDYVIEVNPRLTTSYVGLRAAAKSNLAAAMLRVAEGDAAPVEFLDRALEFDAGGNVSFVT